MAYTRRGSKEAATPVPADPGVISLKLVNSASETNLPIYVPWDGCRLAYCYAVVTTIIDTVGSMEIDLELDTAGGTELMTISVAGATVGTEIEGTFTDEASGRHLSSSNKIIAEIDGSTTGTGECDLYLYFEPDTA